VAELGWHGMNSGPAMLTIILQAIYVATKEWSILPTTLDPMALITQLIIQNIRFNLHLL